MSPRYSRLRCVTEKAAFVLVYLARTVGAAAIPDSSFAGDEFSNNLFSDLAPLLTLFGEQVTRQYQAQSLGWADNIIFACAPLGILTAVVSAIRVAGPNWLRGVIGRVREGHGMAEVELMSSTSESVCELWNGLSIVRLLGSPDLLELVYIPRSNVHGDQRPEVYSIKEAVEKGLLQGKENERESFRAILERSDPPNLSLSVEGALCPPWELWVFAAIAIIVQSGVIAYNVILVVYLKWTKGSLPISGYALPCALFGGLLVVVGLLICSHVIEGTTTEVKLYPREIAGIERRARVMRIQKGSQKVNDQMFKAFAFPERDFETNTDEGVNYMSQNIIMSRNLPDGSAKFRIMATFGSFATIIGFIVQFVGLRGMHWSATVVQLGATLVMTAIRSWVRRGLSVDPQPKPIPEGRELDWLAKEICGSSDWNVKSLVEAEQLLHPPEENNNFSLARNTVEIRTRIGKIIGWYPVSKAARGLTLALTAFMNHVTSSNGLVVDETRIKSYDTNAGANIEYFQTFRCGIGIEVGGGQTLLNIEMRRTAIQGDPQFGPWYVDEEQIEAVISLWMDWLAERRGGRGFDAYEQTPRLDEVPAPSEAPATVPQGPQKSSYLKVLGRADPNFNIFYNQWIYRGSGVARYWPKQVQDPEIENDTFPNGLYVLFRNNEESGRSGARETKTLIGCSDHVTTWEGEENRAIRGRIDAYPKEVHMEPISRGPVACVQNSTRPIEEAFAQDIFAKFMCAAAGLVTGIEGTTTEVTVSGDGTLFGVNGIVRLSPSFKAMRNTALIDLAESVEASGLFTVEEALMAIIPPLWAQGKLPKLPKLPEPQPKSEERSKESQFMEKWIRSANPHMAPQDP